MSPLSHKFCPGWVGRAGAFLALAWLTVAAWAGPATVVESLRLRDGQALSGRFNPQHNGVFHFSETGGRLYTWSQIAPESLPEEFRAARREELLKLLFQAQALYESDRLSEAQPLFQRVYAARDLLLADDLALPAAADLAQKAQGMVRHGEHWLPFAARQQALGLAYDAGRWLPKEQVAEIQVYRQAFARALASDNPTQAAIDLRALRVSYPESAYNELADQLITRLLAPPPAPAPVAAPVAAPPAPAQAPVPVRDRLDEFYGGTSRVSTRSFIFDDSRYTTVRPPRTIWRNHSVIYHSGGWYPWSWSGSHCVRPPSPPRGPCRTNFVPVIKIRL